MLISKYHRRGRGIAVGDMVSVRHPVMPEEGAIKRVLGLPGDFVGRDTPGGVEDLQGEGGVGEEQEVGEEEDEREETRGEGMGTEREQSNRRRRHDLMIQVRTLSSPSRVGRELEQGKRKG